MNGDNKVTRILLWAALVFCLLVLTKYILFKKTPGYYKHYFAHEYKNYKVSDGWEHANLHPFFTIRLFSSKRVSTEYSYWNIGGNIVGFIPLGILLPLLFPLFKNFLKLTGAVFLLSLLFESTQLFTGIGVFDVDDLILNTSGGIAGYLIYAATRWMFFRLNRE
ncbi:MAG: VanZ family protein [Bacteroidota bacterium]|nr:VanZ family protein [Bacteroidota bacterium]